MSKSLGNFLTIREVTKQYHPLALRYFIMSTHNRSAINYSNKQLEVASGSVRYLYQTLHDCAKAVSTFRENNSEVQSGGSIGLTSEVQECIDKLRKDFYTRMSDDIRTRDFLDTTLQDTSKLINSSLNVVNKKEKQKQKSLFVSLAELEKQVATFLDILGMMAPLIYSEFIE
ncbi:cysteine--tRNA ligase 2, cytoplasmic-like [Papaver somniferum]|uniref:cysteine--tRNA ligase 2, cytoplasmic-like n=1 Tax=Papaver somniferum TaxID=3469 RepID=UPI000E700956|nr:cysteine--tRNA ligase 2, cytoplasmic-like [Papaver somniferum]